MRNARWAFAVAGTLFVAGVAQAEMLEIENAGFEDLLLNDGAWQIGNVPGWTITGATGSYNPTTDQFYAEAPFGSNTGFTNGGTFTQELDYVLEADTDYMISGFIGARMDFPMGDAAIELWAGDTLIASAEGDTAVGEFSGISKMFNSVGNTSPLVGEQLTIKLRGEGGQVNFDNITLEAITVPAPGALALLGLAGVVSRRRRK